MLAWTDMITTENILQFLTRNNKLEQEGTPVSFRVRFQRKIDCHILKECGVQISTKVKVSLCSLIPLCCMSENV